MLNLNICRSHLPANVSEVTVTPAIGVYELAGLLATIRCRACWTRNPEGMPVLMRHLIYAILGETFMEDVIDDPNLLKAVLKI